MKSFVRKFLLMTVGVLFMGFSVRLLVMADMGTDPFTTACLAIAAKTGWLLGSAELLVNAILFAAVMLLGREQIGLGTLANMVLVGYVADFCGWCFGRVGLSAPQSLMGRIALMAAALTVFVFAASLYMNAELGTAPYDAAAFILSKRIHSLSFRTVRILWDAAWIVFTWLAGGKVGPVAALIVLTMGPSVNRVGQWLKQDVGGKAL